MQKSRKIFLISLICLLFAFAFLETLIQLYLPDSVARTIYMTTEEAKFNLTVILTVVTVFRIVLIVYGQDPIANFINRNFESDTND